MSRRMETDWGRGDDGMGGVVGPVVLDNVHELCVLRPRKSESCIEASGLLSS